MADYKSAPAYAAHVLLSVVSNYVTFEAATKLSHTKFGLPDTVVDTVYHQAMQHMGVVGQLVDLFPDASTLDYAVGLAAVSLTFSVVDDAIDSLTILACDTAPKYMKDAVIPKVREEYRRLFRAD